ncbi:unannotated protein [freshwater metagenome]|uniref:Unannotated protein n=1 Tax=freshwater metagenome TaxID=449393 RepID=A0A6J6WYP8_9ZZZZ
MGQGLIEAFSNVCESCHGRGIHVSLEPIDRSTHRPSSEGGFSHSSGPVKDSSDHHDHHDHQDESQDVSQDDDITPLGHDQDQDQDQDQDHDHDQGHDQDSDDSSGETLAAPRGMHSVPTKGGARRPRRGKGR